MSLTIMIFTPYTKLDNLWLNTRRQIKAQIQTKDPQNAFQESNAEMLKNFRVLSV